MLVGIDPDDDLLQLLRHALLPPVLEPVWSARWAVLLRAGQSLLEPPAQALKTETSRTPIPIRNELALMLAANVQQYGGDTVVTNEIGKATSPWAIERAIRSSRGQVEGLPECFRFHDLRRYLASLLIGKGCDVKVVQSRLRHASATTTLNTYGHLWPDKDESTRNAIASALRCVPVVSQSAP